MLGIIGVIIPALALGVVIFMEFRKHRKATRPIIHSRMMGAFRLGKKGINNRDINNEVFHNIETKLPSEYAELYDAERLSGYFRDKRVEYGRKGFWLDTFEADNNVAVLFWIVNDVGTRKLTEYITVTRLKCFDIPVEKVEIRKIVMITKNNDKESYSNIRKITLGNPIEANVYYPFDNDDSSFYILCAKVNNPNDRTKEPCDKYMHINYDSMEFKFTVTTTGKKKIYFKMITGTDGYNIHIKDVKQENRFLVNCEKIVDLWKNRNKI